MKDLWEFIASEESSHNEKISHGHPTEGRNFVQDHFVIHKQYTFLERGYVYIRIDDLSLLKEQFKFPDIRALEKYASEVIEDLKTTKPKNRNNKLELKFCFSFAIAKTSPDERNDGLDVLENNLEGLYHAGKHFKQTGFLQIVASIDSTKEWMHPFDFKNNNLRLL